MSLADSHLLYSRCASRITAAGGGPRPELARTQGGLPITRRDCLSTAHDSMQMAGFSVTLQNKLKQTGLGREAYSTLPVQFDPAAFRRPLMMRNSSQPTLSRSSPTTTMRRSSSSTGAPNFVAGIPGPPKRRHETTFGVFHGGKRLVPENPTMLSSVDTVLFGRDIDQSEETASFLSHPMFEKSAGLSKWATQPAMGWEPPTIRPDWAPHKAGGHNTIK
mmetsp:Transcript_23244/g.51155  ORF Transcript_23244/g.51155 Transcript_23244/m.51155 type:complete len:219 (+) Transcript_23244:29-685(+)